MRVLGLIVLTTVLIVPKAYSQNLADCFQNKDDNSAISICVSKIYAAREAARNIMENEFKGFIENDQYLTLPEDYGEPLTDFSKEIETPPLPSTPVFDPNDDPEHRKVQGMKRDLQKEKQERENKAKIKRLMSEEAQKRAVNARMYERKKHLALNTLKESKKQFETYRETECTRQGSAHDDTIMQDISYKSCLYDLTNHRIKMLQRSMAK